LFGEKAAEIVKAVSHRHMTFTVPKILRGYFRRNRKLLKLLVQSAHYAVEQYFREALGMAGGYTGGIYCVQSQGSLFNYHPHIHALVVAGIIKDGRCYEQINISTTVIAEIFRSRLLSVLLEQGVIGEGFVEMLLNWNHNSGFNAHTKGRIKGDDTEAIENVARYMSRAAISVDRVEYHPDDNTVTVYEKQDRTSAGKSATYTLMEFMALLAGHIPSSYESLVYYYGVYSSSHRGKEKRDHGDQPEAAIEIEELKGKKGTVDGKVTTKGKLVIKGVVKGTLSGDVVVIAEEGAGLKGLADVPGLAFPHDVAGHHALRVGRDDRKRGQFDRFSGRCRRGSGGYCGRFCNFL